MHLTLLHVGETPQRLRDRYERFVPFFQTMFKDAGFTFDWHPVNVLDGEPLPAPDAVQGVVITGSAYGVYDGNALDGTPAPVHPRRLRCSNAHGWGVFWPPDHGRCAGRGCWQVR